MTLEEENRMLRAENEKLAALLNNHVPLRREPPATVKSVTHKFDIAGNKGYLIVGISPDLNGVCSLSIHLQKEGSTLGGVMSSFGRLFSLALQYGVPLSSLVHQFEWQRFEPSGQSTNTQVGHACSVIDYIARWLGHTFIPDYKETEH